MGYDPATRQGEAKPPGVGVGGEEDEGEELMAARNGRRKGRGRRMDDDEEEFEEVDDEEDKQGEMERKLEELSRREDVYELLSRSLAPSIWEMDDVKKGILLQLFGGTNKSIAKGGGGGGPRYRGDINVLLVGDPGTSKSQILGVSHFL
jgi:DNA replication licensing factor MCM4